MPPYIDWHGIDIELSWSVPVSNNLVTTHNISIATTS